MRTEIRVPNLGDSVTEATVSTWFKKPGETVAVDEMLCELETDKVTVEVPSPVAGILDQIIAGEGETIPRDGLLGLVKEPIANSLPALDIFDGLPDDPNAAVLELYRRVERYFENTEGLVTEAQKDAILKTIVACEELSVNCVFDIKPEHLMMQRLEWNMKLEEQVEDLKAAIYQGEATEKIQQLRSSFKQTRGTEAAEISKNGIAKIKLGINLLEEMIDAHPFDERRLKFLKKQILLIRKELDKDGTTGKSLITRVGIIGAIIAGSTSFLADSPAALATIGEVVALISYETSEDEELPKITKQPEILRLPAPPK